MIATELTFHSICERCSGSISYITGQRARAWDHDVRPVDRHEVKPELRFAIDATCPGCKYPEIGYAPARQEFTCSRCGHTQTERPPA